MGVTQLWQVLAPVERHQTLASLEGLTLAVDLSIWVCETQCVKQMQGVVSKPFLRNLFFRISHLTQLGVKLVFVIEGTAPELKWEVMMQRQQTRYPGRQGKQLSQRPVSKQTRRNFNACLKECCVLLDILGIPYVQSLGEAEAMCALLDSAGIVDGCLTNDGDAFLYGARTVYRNFTMNTKDPHVEMYRMSDVENQLEVDRGGLVALGLLLGCDFVPKGVPGIGVANATKLLQSLKGMDVLKRLQEWRKMSESQCVNQAEVLARRKAIGVPDFPQVKVIQEFMTAKDRCPSSISPWKRPLLAKFQDFALVKLEWPVEYTLEKALPLITLWDMQDVLGSSNPSTHQHLKPRRIVKTRVRQGIPCYEVEWYKPVTDTSYDGDYFVTVETQELFARCYPHVVRLLEMESSEANKKKKKSQAKKKKKSSVKAGDNISEALNNLSFNFEQMNLAAVTANVQQAVKSLPQSLPEYESQQASLVTKIKAQKHYTAGHAIAPGSTSYTAEYDMPSVVPTSQSNTIRSSSNSSVGVNSQVILKKVQDLDVSNSKLHDSDDENLLPFLERVKLRMKVKQSQSSSNPDLKPTTEKSDVQNTAGKSGKKKNKKKKGAQQSSQDNSSQNASNSGSKPATPRVDPRKANSGKPKQNDKPSADLSDMNSLLDDIENLSLLRDDVLRHKNEDAKVNNSLLSKSSTRVVCKSGSTSEPDKLKQRLTFSASQKHLSSPVTPFGITHNSIKSNLRKMSSPHCDSVCSPMSYIQNSGKLSESFDIRDSPGDIQGPVTSKKKAKKARKAAQRAAASLNETPARSSVESSVKKPTNVKKPKPQTPADTKMGLKNMSQFMSTPANLSEIDTTAVKEFGDFKIQTSLLNNLCASLVQAITPKGISKEEYDKLCKALNKLDDKEENSSAAHEWIESEIDKNLKQVSLSTAEAVSKNIHNSFIKAACSPAETLRNISMQTLNSLHGVPGINFESEEFNHLSKSARKKLRRKERLKMSDNSENPPIIADKQAKHSVLSLSVKPHNSLHKAHLGQSSHNETGMPGDLPVKTLKKQVHVGGTGECNRTNNNQSLSKGKLASPSCYSSDHLIHMVSGTNEKANRITVTGASQQERQMLLNNNSSVNMDLPATINSEEAPKKKKKKKKKKKVRKAESITNLSADESMVGGLQQTLCSGYLRKAIENLRASNQDSINKVEKASPVMDLSADDTMLELEDISSQLSGLGSCLDLKTKIKIARKRSSLEKMKKSQSRENGNDAAKHVTDQDSRCSSEDSVTSEPVLSLNKVISNETEANEMISEHTVSDDVEVKTYREEDIISINMDEDIYINREDECSDGNVFTAATVDNGLISDGVKDETHDDLKFIDVNEDASKTDAANDAQLINGLEETISSKNTLFFEERQSFEISGENDCSTEHMEADKCETADINMYEMMKNETDKYTEEENSDKSLVVNFENVDQIIDNGLADQHSINGDTSPGSSSTEHPDLSVYLNSADSGSKLIDKEELDQSDSSLSLSPFFTEPGVDSANAVLTPGFASNGARIPNGSSKEPQDLSAHLNSSDDGSKLNKRQELDNSESNFSSSFLTDQEINSVGNATKSSLSSSNADLSLRNGARVDNDIIVISDDDDVEEDIMPDRDTGSSCSSVEVVNGGCENIDNICIHIQLENGTNQAESLPSSSEDADICPIKATKKVENGFNDSGSDKFKPDKGVGNNLKWGLNGAHNEESYGGATVNGHSGDLAECSAFSANEINGRNGSVHVTKDDIFTKGHNNGSTTEDQSFCTNVSNGFDHNNKEKSCD